jgi:flagellar hook assembly protein FlgD
VLSQNYPNPFNPATRIRYGLPRPGEVVVTIHNLVGQEVTKLRAGLQNSGFHEITWDGTDRQREHVTSGIYFYTLSVRAVEGSSFVQTRKMLLLR